MTAIFINGSVGAGKTTTAVEIGRILERRGIPHALIDLDGLRSAWPAPDGDPFNSDLELSNLAAVASNYRASGIERFVLAGVIEHQSMRSRYEDAVGGPVIICRLVLPVPLLLTRLAERHEPGEDLDWHLQRAAELDAILASARVDDVVVEVGADGPADVAERVLAEIGWV